MKRVNLILLILASLLITSLLAACGPSADDVEVPRVTAEELKQRLDDGEDILLIDARIGNRQYELSHIPGAIKNPRSFNDVAQDQTIVAYCASEGEDTSASLASRLYADGFTDVAVLAGGLSAWEESKYPTAGSGSAD